MASSWIAIRTFTTRLEAELVKQTLDERGIPSLIQADDLGGLQPALAAQSGVRLFVAEDDVKRALRALEE